MTDVRTILAALRQRVKQIGSQRDVAAAAGCSQQYLSDVLAGRRPPRGKLLFWLGYKTVTSYAPHGRDFDKGGPRDG